MRAALDGLIVVTAPLETQLARLRQRDGSTEAEARARISSQLSAEEKLRVADFVIDNGGSEEALVHQVEALLEKLR